MSAQQQQSVGYVALVRNNKRFRLLWLGQIVSLLGDWFNLIASAALIATLTDSGTAIGSLFVVRMLAPFLISPIAGVFADRYDRKLILIVTDILRGVIVLGFLLVRTADDVWAGIRPQRHSTGPERIFLSSTECDFAGHYNQSRTGRSQCGEFNYLVGHAGDGRSTGRASSGHTRRAVRFHY